MGAIAEMKWECRLGKVEKAKVIQTTGAEWLNGREEEEHMRDRRKRSWFVLWGDRDKRKEKTRGSMYHHGSKKERASE